MVCIARLRWGKQWNKKRRHQFLSLSKAKVYLRKEADTEHPDRIVCLTLR